MPLLSHGAAGLSVNTAVVYRLVNSKTVNMVLSADDKTQVWEK